jgi:hypothetical protein
MWNLLRGLPKVHRSHTTQAQYGSTAVEFLDVFRILIPSHILLIWRMNFDFLKSSILGYNAK